MSRNTKFKCGGCGGECYNIFRGKGQELDLLCTGCGSVSTISMTAPQLVVDWSIKYDTSKGCATDGWEDDKETLGQARERILLANKNRIRL